MPSFRRSLAFSLFERHALIAISLASNMLLARLLTPDEIGLYSVSLAVIGIAQVLREFGIGNFLIQEKNLQEGHIRTAFGFSLALGTVLFATVFLASPYAGTFYADPRIVETIRLSSLNFLALPFCTISVALLRREMAFDRLMAATLLATLMGILATITLAYAGHGANSMAIGSVITSCATGLGAWLARSERKILLPSFSEWRKLITFGGQSSAASIVTTISMDINDLALGKILNFHAVAILSRAQGLMNLFHRDLMSAVRNVALPAFSKKVREGEPIESTYIASVTNITVFAWPFYGFVGLFPLEILRLLFGTQWDAAAPLVSIFCLAGAVAAASNLATSAILAVGRIDLVTKSELLFQPFRALLTIAAAVYFQSLYACALTHLLTYIAYTPFIYKIKNRCIPNNNYKLIQNLLKSLYTSLITLTPAAAFSFYSNPLRTDPISCTHLFITATLTAIVWTGSIIIFKHPISRDAIFLKIVAKFHKFKE